MLRKKTKVLIACLALILVQSPALADQMSPLTTDAAAKGVVAHATVPDQGILSVYLSTVHASEVRRGYARAQHCSSQADEPHNADAWLRMQQGEPF